MVDMDYEGRGDEEFDFPKYYEKDYTRLMEIKKRLDIMKVNKMQHQLKVADRGKPRGSAHER